MRIITQEEYNNFPIENGIRICPGVCGYYQIKNFGDEASFGHWTKFGDEASFGHGTSFGERATFGHGATFGKWASFGDEASFGHGASFGERARFGGGASFGEGASFGKGARFGEGASFGESCLYNGITLRNIDPLISLFNLYKHPIYIWFKADNTPMLQVGCEFFETYDLALKKLKELGGDDDLESIVSLIIKRGQNP